jgi:aminomethyltransferase
MGLRTPLYDRHVALGARLVDFGGWDMPVHYGSQIEEHHAVRRAVGMFDVSHMCAVDLRGPRVRAYLSYLLANDVARLKQSGKALYSCMLNEAGGVVDDLIAYYLDESWIRLVVNAGTATSDLAWLTERAGPFGVAVVPRRDLAMIAIQGPQAREAVAALLGAAEAASALALPVFAGAALDAAAATFLARTGYTGEDGFELMQPARAAVEFWDRLLGAGVRPCGLGARDTLRLEAGLNLYGADMDETTTPLETGLAWTVALGGARDFIGRAALEAQLARGVPRQQVGVVLEGKGVLRSHQPVSADSGEVGLITSGTFSPTLNVAIGLARVPAALHPPLKVEIRGKQLPVKLVRPPFVRHGRALIEP